LSFYEQGQIQEAIASLQKAVEINPEDTYALYNLGVAFLDNHQPDQAIDALVRVVNLSPNDPYACFNLGQAYEAKRFLKEAKACYKKAFEQAPDKTQISRFAKESCTRL
jgi:superkiller protein 3